MGIFQYLAIGASKLVQYRAVHFALPIVWLITVLAYVGTSTLAIIAN